MIRKLTINSVQSAKRPKTMEQRQAEMMSRNKRKVAGVPIRLATPALRRARLIAIQERMGLSDDKFRELLGLTEQHWRSVKEGKRPVVLGIVKLAEIELTRLVKYTYQHAPVEAPVEVPKEFAEDTELRSKVVMAYVMGETDIDKLAAEFAVRPDIIKFYVANLE